MGMWVALTPTVGVQSLMVTSLALPMRANLPVSLVMCWITNPLTLVPFYFSYYWLGTLLLGFPTGSYSTIAVRIRDQFALLPELGFVDSMRPLGHEILWPMCLGSLVLALDLVNRRTVSLSPDDNLIRALEFFGEQEFDKLPIVESRDGFQKLLGHVRYQDIIGFYQREHESPSAQSMNAASEQPADQRP